MSVLAFHDLHRDNIEEDAANDNDDIVVDDDNEHADDGEIAGVNEDDNDLPYDNNDDNYENEQELANKVDDGDEGNNPARVQDNHSEST